MVTLLNFSVLKCIGSLQPEPMHIFSSNFQGMFDPRGSRDLAQTYGEYSPRTFSFYLLTVSKLIYMATRFGLYINYMYKISPSV